MAWRSTHGPATERAVVARRARRPVTRALRWRARRGRSRLRCGIRDGLPRGGPRGRPRRPPLAVERVAGAQQLGEVLLLPGEGVAVVREARLGLAEGARVVDRAPRPVGHPAHHVVEHLVVDDALQEVAGDTGAV